MFNKVLMVCIGNICRSPVAEYLLKHHFQAQGIHGTVASAGVAALAGNPADPNSVEVMKELFSIDLSPHIARQITQEMVAEHDLLLVMEQSQQKYLEQTYPFSRGKVQLIGRWRNEEIIDPYKKPVKAFKHMSAHIESCLNDWIVQYWPPKGE